MIKDKEEAVRAQEVKSAWLERNCYRYLYGLLAALDSCLDRRLVKTFLGLVLVVWDESVIEKPESLHLQGLSAVRSSRAKRLKRIKPGYFNPPGGRLICVPGYHWLQVLVMGMEGPIHMAHTRWWSTRGEQATERREVERQTLAEVSRRWGSRALHVWDRGFAGNPWLTLAYIHTVRFVLRWPKHYAW